MCVILCTIFSFSSSRNQALNCPGEQHPKALMLTRRFHVLPPLHAMLRALQAVSGVPSWHLAADLLCGGSPAFGIAVIAKPRVIRARMVILQAKSNHRLKDDIGYRYHWCRKLWCEMHTISFAEKLWIGGREVVMVHTVYKWDTLITIR